jgi:hypothetical protein
MGNSMTIKYGRRYSTVNYTGSTFEGLCDEEPEEVSNGKSYHIPDEIRTKLSHTLEIDTYDEKCKYYPTCYALTHPPYSCKACIEHFYLGKSH